MLHSYTVQLYFNPRSRVGNDRLYTSVLHIIAYFNPRSRVGNDAESMKKIMDEIIFQSTFPRGERRKNTFDLPDRKRISIHVPAWGTTRLSQASEDGVHISIHVPAWGTTAADAKKTGDELFQSTFPRGERRDQLEKRRPDNHISIHVPAWGTTANFNNFSPILLYRYYKSAFYITPSF